MVGDSFHDIRLRIEQSKAIARESEVAVQQCQQLLSQLRESLAMHREYVTVRESIERRRLPAANGLDACRSTGFAAD